MSTNLLPSAETLDAEFDVGTDEPSSLRARVESASLAPTDDEALVRYVVYLGAAYMEAERAIAAAGSTEAGYRAVYELYGAAGANAAVLRFHYGEASRANSGERRAVIGRELFVASYGLVLERLEREIVLREERVRNLEAALV